MTNFPNLFRLGGAGSATGHNSHVFQEECQVAYLIDALALMRSRGITSLEVRAEEQNAYMAQTTAKLADTVWSIGGCNSFYLDAAVRHRSTGPDQPGSTAGPPAASTPPPTSYAPSPRPSPPTEPHHHPHPIRTP